MARTLTGPFIVGSLGLAAGKVPITNELGQIISSVFRGETVYAFIPTAGDPPDVVPTLQWEIDGVEVAGATGVPFTVPDTSGTLSFHGVGSSGEVVTSAKGVTIREPGVAPPPAFILAGPVPDLSGLPDIYAGTTFADFFDTLPPFPATASNGRPVNVSFDMIDGGPDPFEVGSAPLGFIPIYTTDGVSPFFGELVPFDFTVLAVPVDAVVPLAELGATAGRADGAPGKITFIYSEPTRLGDTVSIYIGNNPAGDTRFLTSVREDEPFTSNGNFEGLTYVVAFLRDAGGSLIGAPLLVATIDPVAATGPKLPTGLPDLSFVVGDPDTVIDIGSEATGVAGAVWSVTGTGVLTTQTGVVTVPSGAVRAGSAVTVTASKGGLSDTTGFSVTTVAATAPPAEPDALPATGPYTRAQVETLRTDQRTRGVPASVRPTLKVPGSANPLPSGMSISSGIIKVSTGADIPALEGWDFTGLDWVIKGRMRGLTNIKFGNDITTGFAMLDLYQSAWVEKIRWSSFLGAGYYGGFAAGRDCISARSSTDGVNGARIDLLEHCDFYGFGADTIKSCRGGVFRLNYIDTPMNLPAGTAVWSASKTYAAGEWVLSSDGRYAYSALVSGKGRAIPTAKSSNANWQNQDPHADNFNTFYQFDADLLIEGNYVNRSEARRAVDPGSKRAIGINNGGRIIRNNGSTLPLNQVRFLNNIVTPVDANLSFPMQLESLTEPNVVPSILRDDWIGYLGSTPIHPTGRNGHTIENVQDYQFPDGPTQGYDLVGAPPVVVVPDPDPDPVDPPVVDFTTPAITGSIGQSDLAYTTNTGSVYTQLPYPNIPSEVDFTLYQANGAYNTVAAPRKVKLSNATANVNTINLPMTMVALACNYAAQGKPFVHVEFNEFGTSLMDLLEDNDTSAPGYNTSRDRLWSKFEEMLNFFEADYPQGMSRLYWYWYNTTQHYMSYWLRSFAPGMFGQYEDGTKFTLGSRVSTIRAGSSTSLKIDHCLTDFSASGTSKGRGILKRSVAFDFGRRDCYRTEKKGEMDGINDLANDARFKAAGGRYQMWAPGGHGSASTYYGNVEAGYQFHMPSLLLAAGFDIREPNFHEAYTAPDGSYVDVTMLAANGGKLTTRDLYEGNAPNTGADRSQEIFGFEINPANGDGMYWIVRPQATAFPAKYRGTVERLNDTKVRYTPVTPIANGDGLTFSKGTAYHRKDGVFATEDAKGQYRNIPTETVAKFTDPDSVFPYLGFPVRTYEDGFILQRGQTVATTGASTGNVTPPPDPDPDPVDPPVTGDPTEWWTTGANGPTFESEFNILAPTKKVRFATRMFVPGSLTWKNKNGRLHAISNNIAHLDLIFGSTGGARMQALTLRSSDGNEVTPSDTYMHAFDDDIWVTLDQEIDFEARTITAKCTGQPDKVLTFGGGGDGTVRDFCKAVFNGNVTPSSAGIPAGVRIASHAVYLDGSSTPFLGPITGTAAQVNAHPRKVAGSSDAT